MKKFFTFIFIVILFTIVNLFFATKGTGIFPETYDYLNSFASSLAIGYTNIINPTNTFDLALFNDTYYVPYGPLPSIILLPLRFIFHQDIPLLWITIIFGAFNVAVFYLLLKNLKKEYLPKLSSLHILLLCILFGLGTTLFRISIQGSIYHTIQIVSSLFGNIGLLLVLRKNTQDRKYVIAGFLFGLTLLGRSSIFLLILFPLLLIFFDHIHDKKVYNAKLILKEVASLCLPIIPFLGLHFFYNYVRFGNILEYGYSYVLNEYPLSERLKIAGSFSLSYMPLNIWCMIFAFPSFTIQDNVFRIVFSDVGNSIFFLTPPLLTIFFTIPMLIHSHDHAYKAIIWTLWITSIVVIFPSLCFYNTGWTQYGYRYSLDITMMLLLFYQYSEYVET